MSGHFRVDVDPDGLDEAAERLGRVPGELTAAADEVAGAGSAVGGGAWTGGAAGVVIPEITALARTARGFPDPIEAGSRAIARFAAAAREAVEVTVPDLNRRWEQAAADHTAALAAADRARDDRVAAITPDAPSGTRRMLLMEYDDVERTAKAAAGEDLRGAQNALEAEFQQLTDDLTQAAKTTGEALATAVVTTLDPGTTSYDAYTTTATGLPGLGLVRDRADLRAGEAAAEDFNELFASGPRTPEEIDAHLATLDGDSPAFRQAFLAHLDLEVLAFLQRVGHAGVDESTAVAYGEVVTRVAQIMARGSNDDLQGEYPVPDSFYRDWRDRMAGTEPPEEGMILLAEIVQAGQGDAATWDSELVATITRDVIAFERAAADAGQPVFWGDYVHPGFLTTQAQRDQIGDVPGRLDAVAMLLDALRHDPAAALTGVSGADREADPDLLEYLYDGRRDAVGWSFHYGDALGGFLVAATSFVGGGGPGTDEYAAAEVVSSMVDFYGEHPDKLWWGMEGHVVDILTHHIQAVNSTLSDVQYEGSVHVGDPDGVLARDRLTTAVLDPDRLTSLMTHVLQLDHYAEDGRRPLFQEFAAVQTAALRQDFATLATAPDIPPGRLEQIAGQHGAATQAVTEWLRDGLMAAGAEEDEANQAARDAAGWVVGLGTDAIPLDRLGPLGSVAGDAVGGIGDWAVDQVIPETDREGEAAASADETRREISTQNALVHLNWLDDAGLLGPAAPAEWARENPNQRDFLQRDPDSGRWVLRDAAELYQRRAEDPETWNQFVRYWNDHGDPVLRDSDLYENYELGLIGD
ncbi:MAG: hypothetical protein ACFCVG_06900 [Kineosporiaceae bacterium]